MRQPLRVKSFKLKLDYLVPIISGAGGAGCGAGSLPHDVRAKPASAETRLRMVAIFIVLLFVLFVIFCPRQT